jgi:DNA-directed RNA polymerase specialized sigma subunit
MIDTREEAAALIESHLSLVAKVVNSAAANYPAHADRSELQQAGALGLVECAYRFDP